MTTGGLNQPSHSPRARRMPVMPVAPNIASTRLSTADQVRSQMPQQPNMPTQRPANQPVTPSTIESVQPQMTDSETKGQSPGFWEGLVNDVEGWFDEHSSKSGKRSWEESKSIFDTTYKFKSGPMKALNWPFSFGTRLITTGLYFPANYLGVCWDIHKDQNKKRPYLNSYKMLWRVPAELVKDSFGIVKATFSAGYSAANYVTHDWPNKHLKPPVDRYLVNPTKRFFRWLVS